MRMDAHRALLITSPDRQKRTGLDILDPPGVNLFIFLARRGS